jgi:hypothetical protein
MPETGRALREASDALIRDLDALAALEDEKRQIVPGDPRLVDLAERIESIASRVLVTSARQRELTEEVQDLASTGSPSAPVKTIEQTARPIGEILADWRKAERRAESAEEGSAEAREAQVVVDHLRDEYRRAHEDARRQGP